LRGLACGVAETLLVTAEEVRAACVQLALAVARTD
jgi:hypothetical protein